MHFNNFVTKSVTCAVGEKILNVFSAVRYCPKIGHGHETVMTQGKFPMPKSLPTGLSTGLVGMFPLDPGHGPLQGGRGIIT
jgi:hypothetical protein